LLECAGAFSPRVEDQSSDSCFTCVVDIDGTETLFGSPDALGESLLKRLRLLGFEHRSPSAATFMPPGAWHGGIPALASEWLPRGMECTVLAPLPLTVLDPSPEHTENLRHVGHSYSWGTLQPWRKQKLIARLGQAGKELRLLARGESPHLFSAHEASFDPGGTTWSWIRL